MDVLAELEIFHSRPFAPTRRLALSSNRLPTDPAPGPAGLLLGAVMAHHRAALDEELYGRLVALTFEVQEGRRVAQPRLRHRFQQDRHGLTRSGARLGEVDGRFVVDFDNKGTGVQFMLGAVYTAGTLPALARPSVFEALRRGLRWTGSLDQSLFSHLAGRGADHSENAHGDPVGWALRTLGLVPCRGGRRPERRDVQRRFRMAVRAAHPDHGGDATSAARRIDDLTQARRILLS